MKPKEKSAGEKVPRFSEYLPYRSFDPKSRLYYNQGSIAFCLETTPMIGGDERAISILSQMLAEGYAKGMTLSCYCYLSPSVSEKLNEWFVPRMVAGGIHLEMARHRVDYLNNGAWHSLAGDAPFLLRHFRTFIVGELPTKSAGDLRTLSTLRDSIIANFATMNMICRDVEPESFIRLIDEILKLSKSKYRDEVQYNKFDPIAVQCVPRDFIMKQEMDRLVFRTERFDHVSANEVASNKKVSQPTHEFFDVRSFGVRNFPAKWALWDGVNLIGDLFAEQLNIPCPMMLTMTFEVPDQEVVRSKANLRFMRKTQQSESVTGRWNSRLKPQAEEWKGVIEDLARGQNLVNLYYGVTMFSPWGNGDLNERIIKSLFKGNGWDLYSLKRMHIHGLLAALPMTAGSGLMNDMKRNALTHTMTSSTVANLVPLQGEYLGSTIPHMLCVGRRGQPFFWSPLENSAGNHNCCIFGKSGSGKSVFLQELVASLVGSGSHVIVIDDGRSFQNSGVLQGAKNIEFTMSSGFSLNVFKMMDRALMEVDGDYRLECMSLLKAMVGQMAKYRDPLNDTEDGIIDETVNAVWEEHHEDATVDDIIDLLKAHDTEIGRNLGISMQAFGMKGTFGELFVGEPSFALSDRFTVFELSDLSGHEELRAVVLTAIMFMSSQVMRKLDRSIPKALIIDEAWQLLRGGSMAEFVETYARTCRKYGSSLVTATQSLEDYYKSDGSRAALENSDWFVLLEQKAETISALRKSEKLELDGFLEEIVKSNKRKGHYYSGFTIKGPDMVAWGRLVIDRYSALIYSSSPQEFGRIEELKAQGFELSSIIGYLAYGEELKMLPRRAITHLVSEDAAELNEGEAAPANDVELVVVGPDGVATVEGRA
ncbi:MAG: type IV secretion system protein TraC [Betaproteobacteria bacterium]|nr:type IV secretion system protein TraC [Betaproteobacteria bacterium]